MQVYCSGCSVRLATEFYNFEGQLVDPDVVKVIIYNHKFFFDYLTDNDLKQMMYVYEFYGEIDGKICRERKAFQTQFMIS